MFGWVTSIRNQTNFAFLVVKDREGIFQVTVKKEQADTNLLDLIDSITEHSSIGVRGHEKAISKAPHGAEIVPTQLKHLATSKIPPFSIFGGDLPTLDQRLEIRPVDLRREKAQAIFKIRNVVLNVIREYLVSKRYFEIQTPKIISSATEGGAALFSVLYYNMPAFLVQSPQLYKEEMVIPFEKVFEIGPVFRAEESRTVRHLSEVTSVDVEQAFINFHDIMDTLESLVKYVAREVNEKCSAELAKVLPAKIDLEQRFPRVTYDEIINKFKEIGEDVTWGDDISASGLDKLQELKSRFYFIVDWPTATKPFYAKPKEENPKYSETFDLMFGSLEMASGGSRLNSKKELTSRLREQKLKPKAFEYHLQNYDYGMPPHAGFGLGLERLMMTLTGEENIREVTLYPRDKFRLAP